MVSTPDTSDEIYKLIGQCLAHWSLVEHDLSLFFILATKAAPDVGQRVFWSVTSLQAKLKLVDKAMRAGMTWLDPAGENLWKDLKKDISDVNKLRNEVAHGSMVSRQLPDGGDEALFLPFYWQTVYDQQPGTDEEIQAFWSKGLRIADLEDRLHKIQRLSGKCMSVFEQFVKFRKSMTIETF
jgi:hypothetical protein